MTKNELMFLADNYANAAVRLANAIEEGHQVEAATLTKMSARRALETAITTNATNELDVPTVYKNAVNADLMQDFKSPGNTR